MIGNGVFNLILVVAFGLVIFMSSTPENQFGFYMFLMLVLCVISGSHIMTFNAPDLSKKSSSKSKKSRSKNDTDDKSILTHNTSSINIPMDSDVSPRIEAPDQTV